MIVSKNGKSYDTSDGSEQRLEESTPRERAGDRADRARWADDGGPQDEAPVVIVAELAWKPAWSVLSVKELNLAIRREREDLPNRQRRAEEDAERARVRAVIAAYDRRVEAERDRYRNAWETT